RKTHRSTQAVGVTHKLSNSRRKMATPCLNPVNLISRDLTRGRGIQGKRGKHVFQPGGVEAHLFNMKPAPDTYRDDVMKATFRPLQLQLENRATVDLAKAHDLRVLPRRARELRDVAGQGEHAMA